MRVFITGTAGFIGFHLARRLLADGHLVTGFDAMTPYYDVTLKRARHRILQRTNAFRPVIGRLEDMDLLMQTCAEAKAEIIIHLAAQAGVRYSLENPRSYVDSNLVGSTNLLEVAKALNPAHLLLASTSSAYGANTELPFREIHKTDHPLTLYAGTKKAMEAIAHSYAHLWSIPTTVFRFFTVYGPWGRPDMALFKFVDAIVKGMPIEIYGHGKMSRDFTYIDDLVEGIVRLVGIVPSEENRVADPAVGDTLSAVAPYRIVNIGGEKPVGLLRFVELIEEHLGRPAIRKMLPHQPGDVEQTVASAALLRALTGYVPSTTVEAGIGAFIEWYLDYYQVKPPAAARVARVS
jgi:UDP-glucuronate 4-epimerase